MRLLVFLFYICNFIGISIHTSASVNIHSHSEVNDTLTICGKWQLKRTINKTEKVIYKDQNRLLFIFNCKAREITVFEDENTSRGKWSLTNSNKRLHLTTESNQIIYEVLEISNKKLILGLNDFQMIFKRVN